MDTRIRWKVKRRIRDAQITLAVILLFVASQASSGKMQLWDLRVRSGTALFFFFRVGGVGGVPLLRGSL